PRILVWWKPNEAGYVADLNFAGRYSKAEADRITRGRANVVVAVPCATVERYAARVVGAEYQEAFRTHARACVNAGCPEHADKENECCTRCSAGAALPVVHIGHDFVAHKTWCGKTLLSGRACTFPERERVVGTPLVRETDAATCSACIDKRAEDRAEHDRRWPTKPDEDDSGVPKVDVIVRDREGDDDLGRALLVGLGELKEGRKTS
ncbi:MAG: hypothetical protein ACHREM_04595, partial [Polyangiales bacterium]